MVLICICLMISDVDYHFMSIGSLYVFFGEISVKKVLCLCLDWVIIVVMIFDVKLHEFLIYFLILTPY